MKTLNVNGKDFVVVNKRDKDAMKREVAHIVDHYTCKSIYTTYKNPSSTKVEIYENWRRWASATEGLHCFEVAGHNSMTFTLHAIYQPSWDEQYIMIITPSSNKLLKVS